MWDLQPRDSIERNARILGLICHYGFSFVCDQAVGVVAGGSAPNSWYPVSSHQNLVYNLRYLEKAHSAFENNDCFRNGILI